MSQDPRHPAARGRRDVAGRLRGAAAFKGPLQEDPLFPGATESRPEVGVQEGGAEEGSRSQNLGESSIWASATAGLCACLPLKILCPLPRIKDIRTKTKEVPSFLSAICLRTSHYYNMLLMQSWCINVQVTKIMHIGAREIA